MEQAVHQLSSRTDLTVVSVHRNVWMQHLRHCQERTISADIHHSEWFQ